MLFFCSSSAGESRMLLAHCRLASTLKQIFEAALYV